MQHSKVFDHITVLRPHMKGKTQDRGVPLHPEARAALSVWLEQTKERRAELDPQYPMFASRMNAHNGSPRAIVFKLGASSKRPSPPMN